MSFVEGRPSTDDEIFNLIVKVFNSKGRIIADGYNAKNFITAPSGEVTCIDVGLALELNTRHSGRRYSETSTRAWIRLEPIFRCSFETYGSLLPKSTLLVKSLLFIKKHRPDMSDVNFFLSPHEGLLTKLELATRRTPSPSEVEIRQALEALDIAAAARLLEIGAAAASDAGVAASDAGVAASDAGVAASGAGVAAGGAGVAAGGAGVAAGDTGIAASTLRGFIDYSMFAVREAKEPDISKRIPTHEELKALLWGAY